MGAVNRLVAVTDQTRFVNNNSFLELEIVDPTEGMNERPVFRTRDQVVRLRVHLRVHLGDHGLPEMWRTTVPHGLRVVARDVERDPTILELKVLDLGVDTFSGHGINGQGILMAREVAEALICDANPPDRDARKAIFAIIRICTIIRILSWKPRLHVPRRRKTLCSRGARTAPPRLLCRLIT